MAATFQPPYSTPIRDEREPLIDVAAVAVRLGMSEQWVRDHIERRHPKIPCVRLGAAVRFRPADIDRFIELQLNQPRPRRRR
jgi:predicted DNA-binding transcriptional regulator AlpA